MIKIFKTTRVICLLLVLAVMGTLAGWCKKIVTKSQSLSTTSVRTQAE